ncbi:MAG: TonB-dependent receptor [Bacteroidales bacterium]|nr:TonB-dependent receptor [Bacteroidales bacterium]
MRISLFLMFALCMQLMAAPSYSQTAQLTLHMNNAKIKDVLVQIEEQSEFYFLYNGKLVDVNRTVSINVDGKNINEVLNSVFSGTEVAIKVVDRQIVLLPVAMQNSFQTEAVRDGIAVSGVVTDATGDPLPGVNVSIKGTLTGVVSNANGRYTINVPNRDAVLSFSFVGYATQEIPAGDRTSIDVTLIEEASEIEEVVVVGYGTVRRKDLTGSVTSVKGTELGRIPVTNAAQAITGKMAGVQVSAAEGSPDAEIKIRIRGGGSITQDNSPLYIVDGFPVGNFSDISIADIETIDVLKDASSSAIYGARGANGVVLITTKRGKEGRINVNFNMYYGTKKIAKTLNVLNPYEYVLWQYELGNSTGTTADNVKRFYGYYDDYELYKNQKGVNWQKEVFGRTAITQNYNLNVNGGTAKGKFSLGLTHSDEEGVMINSGITRNNVNLNLSSEFNDRWSVDFVTRFANYAVDGGGTSGSSRFLVNAIQYPTTDGLSAVLEDTPSGPDIESYNLLINPVDVANDTYRKLVRNSIAFNGAVNFKFWENLTFRSEWGADLIFQNTDLFYGSNTSYSKQYGGYPIAGVNENRSSRYRAVNTLTYNKRGFVEDHDLNVMVGQEIISYTTQNTNAESRYFPMGVNHEQALAMMIQGKPEPTTSNIAPDDNMASWFGRINYSLLDRYLATVTLRADGSSKFRKGNQWGYFPSAALAWRISEENFLKNINWLSNLKVRASYGQAGNNRIADNMWKMLYETSLDGSNISSSNSGTEEILNQLRPGSVLSNPDLKWETTITRNVGFDLGFFNSRLTAMIDFYLNTTRDLLIQASIPSSTGYSTQMQNIGTTSNRGLELTLDGIPVQTKDFYLSVNFNISFNRNKIEKLGENKSLLYRSDWYGTQGPSGDYIIREGDPVGQMYGYVTDGMYSFDDFSYNGTTGQYTINSDVPSSNSLIGGGRWFGPGTLKLKNLNPDEDNIISEDKDRTVIGNANPKHSGGFTLTAAYKGFDFSASFNWVYGNSVYNANKLGFTSYPGTRTFQNLYGMMSSEHRFVTFDKTGEYTGTPGEFVSDPDVLQRMNRNATIWSPMFANVILHSWAIEDGSFLRLNNLTLGYTLPQQVMSKLKMQQIRIYVSGYNLYMWTKYTGYDPEVDVMRATPMTPGVDYSAYPRSRSIVAGINVSF